MVGQKWKAVINGKRSINGARHSVTLSGEVEECPEGETVIDLLRALADHLEENTKELEIKDSFQITLYPNQE